MQMDTKVNMLLAGKQTGFHGIGACNVEGRMRAVMATLLYLEASHVSEPFTGIWTRYLTLKGCSRDGLCILAKGF